jgi:nicotinamidase-related amidase
MPYREPQPTPAWIQAIPAQIAEMLIERHLYRAGEVWGLARRYADQELPYDEVGSSMFFTIARDYHLLDRIGGWNEEARLKAIRFWQAWQDPATGRFFDPRDRKRIVNEKYCGILLEALGGKPLYPHSLTSKTGEIDMAEYLRQAEKDPGWDQGGWGAGAHTGAMTVEIFEAIDGGRADLIPALEQGINFILGHQDADGLFGPPTAGLDGRVGGGLKVLARLHGRLGMALPRARALADSLIAHQLDGGFFRSSPCLCIPCNTAHLLVYCLEDSEYRRNDLLRAMESVAKDLQAWRNPDGSLAMYRGNPGGVEMVFLATAGVVGACLNWKDCPLPNPIDQEIRGRKYRYQLRLLPDGQAKIALKEPVEKGASAAPDKKTQERPAKATRVSLPAAYYRQHDADPKWEVPAESYGGWARADIEIDLRRTALVAMHAWNAGTPAEYPGLHRIFEYLARAASVAQATFPPLLAAARAAGLKTYHVVAGGDYYKTCPGYLRAAALAPAEPPAPQIEADPTLEVLKKFKREHRFGTHNLGDVERWYREGIDFSPYARPRDDEDVAESTAQLFAVCRRDGVNHLVYAGFATNWCLLMSPGGMFAMHQHGLLCSVIRQATTAVEIKETARRELWKELALCRVGMAFGFVFDLDDFIRAISAGG